MDAQKFVDHYRNLEMKFWHFSTKGMQIRIYQLLNFLIDILHVCKVKIHENTYLAIKIKNKVELIDIEKLSQKLILYIQDEFPNSKGIINKVGILDALIEKSITFYNKNILTFLPIYNVPVNNDTKNTCEIAYGNKVLHIHKDKIVEIDYDNYNSNILLNQIIDRSFVKLQQVLKGEFARYTWNLAGHSLQRFKVLCCVIGYLTHRYKDPANPKMIILIDQVISELDIARGGSGKSLFLKGVGHIRNLIEVSGKKFQSNQRFAFQRVDIWTDVILVNDASKNENLENWYNVLADGFVMERKYEKEQFIPYDLSFKVAMTTNHMIRQPEGNSSERRKHEVEVSEYYGKELTPQQEFGHNLFNDWDSSEWNEFDNFIVFCVQYYLEFGLLESPKINILKRKLIAEVGIEMIEFIDDKIAEGVTKFHKKDMYDEFVKGGFINRKYIPQRNSFTRKLKKYFEYNELNYTEVPSDSKKYIQLITDNKMDEITTQTIKDKDTNYTIVDTDNKLKRLDNKLKKTLK